ncbi:nucleolar DEAD-box protein required for synthesis of 60S ribosomal subunit [Tulasnella sp. 424]|nr:nucleolar DEAD-box protein required for synthesis of 60S ribosomal subunit [Tulasnella sp. 424]
MPVDDFILTLESEPEDEVVVVPPPKKSKKKKSGGSKKEAGVKPAPPAVEEASLNPDFNFDLAGGGDDVWNEGNDDELEDMTLPDTKAGVTIDDIIARRKATGKRKREVDDVDGSEEEEEEDVSEEEEEDELDESEEDDGFGKDASFDLGEDGDDDGEDELEDEDTEDSEDEDELDDDERRLSSDESEEETAEDKAKKDAYFAPDQPVDGDDKSKSETTTSFLNLNLSRPLLRAIQAMNFTSPTPIQRKAIPIALQGLDVLGSAVTGSGKTAAFMIPILERLMFKDRNSGAEVRVLILTPTRELAVQCAEVGKSLSRFMDITFAVLVGGVSLKTQETALRTRPDIVIATPGRLIDHIQNTPTFTLSALDILVLDEADRMLSDGFADELQEVIRSCPKNRQTMLFSATMTDDVDSLVRLSMNRPVRLFVDPKKTVAKALVQEFVRIRKESDRQAFLSTLCKRTAKRRTIIFFRQKVLCHQMKVVFGLLGFKAAEIHGNLTQEQRIDALRKFKDGEVDYLLATDVASRGLDIKGVETVINYDMPGQIELYLHRVGRTARASARGRSISLVGEADRRMLKAVMKRSDAGKVKHRLIPPDQVKAMMQKLEELKPEVAAVLQEEQAEKEIRAGEMQVQRAQNMIEHKDQILSRPKRTWFQSNSERQEAKDASMEQYSANFPGSSGSASKATKRKNERPLNHKLKRRKTALEELSQDKGRAVAQARGIRDAKKALRPKKITQAPPERSSAPKHAAAKPKLTRQKVKSGGFDHEFGVRKGGGASVREGARSKRGDNVPLRDKKGRGTNTGSKGKVKGKMGGKGRR